MRHSFLIAELCQEFRVRLPSSLSPSYNWENEVPDKTFQSNLAPLSAEQKAKNTCLCFGSVQMNEEERSTMRLTCSLFYLCSNSCGKSHIPLSLYHICMHQGSRHGSCSWHRGIGGSYEKTPPKWSLKICPEKDSIH